MKNNIREICPQVEGIYRSRRHEGKYSFLLLPENCPDAEYYSTDAYLVDRYGNKKPGFEHPIAVTSSDFGDFYV